MAAELGNGSGPAAAAAGALAIAAPQEVSGAAGTTDNNDTTMTIALKRDVAATEIPAGTSPPARRMKRGHEDAPASGASSASKPTTLEELGAVVQSLWLRRPRVLRGGPRSRKR